MPVCGNCGAHAPRVRSRWEGANQLPDECSHCAPESFQEKFKSVRDGTIALGYEYDHTKYKYHDGDYHLTDEGRQDLEDAVTRPSQDDELAYQTAVERKRQERRTHPMTASERELALNRVRNRINAARQSETIN